jgi:hypothetical protein
MGEKKMIYKIKAQTKENDHGITVTAQTKLGVTHEEAINIAKKDILLEPMAERYTNFIVEEIATEDGWKCGHVNFCPRCGCRLEDIDDNYYRGECFDCHAEIDVHITTNESEGEDT